MPHYCRNPRCRMKLPAPVENEHHAFCCKGCFSGFYRSRCAVCEEQMRPKREGQRIKSGHKKCEAEYRKFRHVFSFPLSRGQISDESPRSAHSTGLKFGLAGDRPTAHCLREWWWGDPGIGDHSLYDREGWTIARIVLDEDGRYHLRSPVTWPRQSWPDLTAAKRAVEAFALVATPTDPKLAARIKRDNEVPHPMGPPLNRRVSRETAIGSDWKPIGFGIAPAIPEFLRREKPGLCT